MGKEKFTKYDAALQECLEILGKSTRKSRFLEELLQECRYENKLSMSEKGTLITKIRQRKDLQLSYKPRNGKTALYITLKGTRQDSAAENFVYQT